MRASREAQPISLEEEAPPLGSEWPVGISQARREVKRQRVLVFILLTIKGFKNSIRGCIMDI